MLRTRTTMAQALLLVALLPGIAAAQNAHRVNIDTLAVIGKKAITSESFARLYNEKLVRLGLTDNGETRRGYLQNLVDDEILIGEAKRRKLDRTGAAPAELSRIKLQELLNAYSDKHFSSAIDVTEDDLRELFLKMNTRIAVRHLYSPTKEGADSLYQAVSKGKSFGELARNVFSDPQLKRNGGFLGYVSVDEMDPDFEKAAYGMKVGETSKPVKTVQGYSIIRVDDIRRNPLATEGEFQKAKERFRGLVRKRKYEEAVKQYTSLLRSRLNIRFDDALVARLYAMTQQSSLNTITENKSLSISRDDLARVFAASTTRTWTVKDVIEALSTTTEQQRTWIRTKENLEDFIAGLIIRGHMAQQAHEEKLDAGAGYRKNVEYAFDSYLLKTLESQLKRQITFSPDSLRSYYDQNKDRFMTLPEIRLSGILVENAALSDSIRQMLQRDADFDELAKRFSIQTLTAERGGDLGYYREQELGTLGKEAFALRAGEWRGPITDDGKYLFLKCTDVKKTVYRPFEECAKEIEDLLVSLAWTDARARDAESFRREIPCRIFPERLAAVSLSLSYR